MPKQSSGSFVVYRNGDIVCAMDLIYRTNLICGSGAADVIQTAIDSGHHVLIQAGVYNLSHGLRWRDKYVLLEGEGHGVQYARWGTVLVQQFNGTVIDVTYSDWNNSGFEIKSMQIEGGTREGYTGIGVYVHMAKGWLIEDLVIRFFSDHALRADRCGWRRLLNMFTGGCGKHLSYYTRNVNWKWVVVEACTVTSGNQDRSICWKIQAGRFMLATTSLERSTEGMGCIW